MNDNNNSTRQGDISVETAHIFPIIKKWLYSEKDIFLRELVSNAADAVTKYKRLVSLGELEGEDNPAYRITVSVSKTAKTLTVSDNGIGMTEDELIRYLGNIALSGALDFIKKYEGDQKDGNQSGIIGHFGLGFYSAFMVADTVEVITKSCQPDSPAVRWVCHADGSYELYPAERDEKGTDVILHVSDEEAAYTEPTKIRDMLDKYCSFMPTEIYFVDEDAAEEEEPSASASDTDKSDDSGDHDSDSNTEAADQSNEPAEPQPKEPAEPQPINDIHPLWQKSPSECTPEEYKEFYRKVFHDFREPLFWIHINADYPLNFKGILYFPRLNNEYESIEGQVKLYYNQVFVADNIKEVIPEYLLMLKGVLDCPELPLNVSRSYLQNNTYVAKIAAHIVKKVSDKLNAMCENEREAYEGVWDSIKTFVEYACMRDRKFYDRAHESVLLRLTDGSYKTIGEYLEDAKEKHENTVYYTTDPESQAQYIALFEAEGIRVAVLDKLIDSQFIQMLESYESDVKYRRIDADVAEALKKDGEAADNETLTELFRKVSQNEKLKVTYQNLKDESIPAMLTVSEESRRMEEMMKMYTMQTGHTPDAPAFPLEYTLIVNTSSPLTARLTALCTDDAEKADLIAAQIYRLSVLSQRKLTSDELKSFLTDSFDLLNRL